MQLKVGARRVSQVRFLLLTRSLSPRALQLLKEADTRPAKRPTTSSDPLAGHRSFQDALKTTC